MQYDTLGADEQTPAIPFLRLISPTDIQEVGWKMGSIIADRYSWDWINPTVWRIVGFESGNIIKFLERYILISRQWQKVLNAGTEDQYKQYFINEYGYQDDDLNVIFNAFYQVRNAGLMPDTIYMPWTYEPTTITQDIGKATGEAVKSLIPKIALLGIAGIAAYAFFSKGVPKMVTRKKV